MENLSLLDLTPSQVEQQRAIVAARVRDALSVEGRRIMTALADELIDRDYRAGIYFDTAVALMTAMVPRFDVDEWRGSSGERVVITCDPYSCCGYCSDCEDHHGVSRVEVCDLGQCHACEHVCDH